MAFKYPSGFNKVPSVVQIDQVGQSFVSLLDIHKPEIDENFVKRYGNQRLTSLLEMIGRSKPVAQSEYSHYEENWYHSSFEASVASAPTSGYAATTFTIASAYVDANGYTAPRVRDVVEIGVNRQQAIITAKPTETTITLKPKEAWSFTSANDSQAIRFVVIGREGLEGGTTPSESLSSEPIKYENRVQIIDGAYRITGSEATNQIWFEVEGPNGETGFMWRLQGEKEEAIRFMNYKEMLMLRGKQVNSASTAYTEGFRGTRGLITDIEQNGQNFDLANNPMGRSDMQDIVRSIDRFRGAKENLFLAGIELRQNIDDMLGAVNGAYVNGTHFGTFNNSENMMINLGFDGFQMDGYKFALKTYDLFNHPQLLGADGFDYVKAGIIIPMDSGKDARTKESIPSIAERYKSLGGIDRKYKSWVTGSAGDVATNDIDEIKVNYRCEAGFEAFGLNRFVWVTA